MSFFRDLIYTLPAVLIAISMHEFAHGYVSWRLGDPTPRQTGRLSLNPLNHLDPVGTLCLLFFHFGWAKPVQVNPWYYKKRKQGMVLTALAGPCMNFIIAFVCTLLMGLLLKITGGFGGGMLQFIWRLLLYISSINMGLGMFNLIPVPPLDGSKVLGAVLPEEQYFGYMQFERYGTLVLMLLLATRVLDGPLNLLTGLLNSGMWAVTNLIFGL